MFKFLKIFFSKSSNRPASGSFFRAVKVLTIEKHPNADRLRVARVSDGEQEYYPIVCGAPNLAEGQIVCLALPGATIPRSHHNTADQSFVLEKATIRGIESQGMICSRYELGFSDDQNDGIWVLPSDTAIGSEVSFST